MSGSMPKEGRYWVLKQVAATAAAEREPGIEARARSELGAMHEEDADWAAGLSEYERAADLYSTIDERELAADAHLACCRCLIRLDRPLDSIPHAQALARIALGLGDTERWSALAISVLGEMVSGGRLDEAVAWSAEVLSSLANCPPDLAERVELQMRLHRAIMFAQRSDFEESLAEARRCNELGQHVDRETAARSCYFAGVALVRLGRDAEAIVSFRRALELSRELRLRDVASAVLEQLATLAAAGPVAAAEEFDRLAGEYARSGDGLLEGLCRLRHALALEEVRPTDEGKLADLFASAGEQLESERAIADAGRAFERAAHHAGMAGSLSPTEAVSERTYFLGRHASQLLLSVRDFWQAALAEHSAASAVRASRGGDHDDRAARSFASAARYFRRAGRWEEASGTWIAAAIEWRPGDGERRLCRLARMALATHELGRTAELVPGERRRNEESQAPGLLILAARIRDASRTSRVPESLAPLLWDAEQAVKGRTFQDQDLQHAVWAGSTLLDPTIARLSADADNLRGHLDRLEDRVNRLLAGNGSNSAGEQVEPALEERDEAKLQLAEAQLELERRIRAIPSDERAGPGLASVPPASPEDVARVLRYDEAYVGFLEPAGGGDAVRAVVTSRGLRSVARNPLLTGGQLDTLKRHVQWCDVDDPLHEDDEHEEAQLACRVLLGDLPSSIQTLFVSPHYQLSGIAWTAAAEEAAKVGNPRYSVALLPSAGSLCAFRARGRRTFSRDYFGVACDANGDLKIVDAEIANARSHYFESGRAEMLDSAHCRAFFEHGTSARLLHFACHADRSGLLLSHDGAWTPPSALVPISIDADIVLLTGCHAGLLVDDLTNEFAGVIRQLIHVSRARAAVASREAVPDSAGFVFSDLLLAALTGKAGGLATPPREPLPLGPAVRWAMEAMPRLDPATVEAALPATKEAIRPADPSWWGPWIVVGDPSLRLVD